MPAISTEILVQQIVLINVLEAALSFYLSQKPRVQTVENVDGRHKPSSNFLTCLNWVGSTPSIQKRIRIIFERFYNVLFGR